MSFDRIVLLDTDTIAVGDLRPFLGGDAVQGKIVDLPIPSLAALNELYDAAGGRLAPELVVADAASELTFLGNANGGFYAIPRALAVDFANEWQRWVQWLLINDRLLRKEGRLNHVDQIAVAFAVQISKIPFDLAPSNVNYFIHFEGRHSYFDPRCPIALIRYHNTMNVLGLLEPPYRPNQIEREAITRANRQISESFDNMLFWDYRYATHPQRGSGLGSRGRNLQYKRRLLRREGIEMAESVLDVGCGDLEVLRALRLPQYLGIDVSPLAIAKARTARPDLAFSVYTGQPIPDAAMVLCFEVLIHQTTRERYINLVKFLADHTRDTLLVSGYESGGEEKVPRHILYFYEPLSVSLANTGRFQRIEHIGGHSDVLIYRCSVTSRSVTRRAGVLIRRFIAEVKTYFRRPWV